jgi:hypothetical protein
MKHPQITIAELILVVLVAAVGLAAIRSGSPAWAGAMFSITFFAMICSYLDHEAPARSAIGSGCDARQSLVYYPGKEDSHASAYQPDAPARVPCDFPRWRVGLVCRPGGCRSVRPRRAGGTVAGAPDWSMTFFLAWVILG